VQRMTAALAPANSGLDTYRLGTCAERVYERRIKTSHAATCLNLMSPSFQGEGNCSTISANLKLTELCGRHLAMVQTGDMLKLWSLALKSNIFRIVNRSIYT